MQRAGKAGTRGQQQDGAQGAGRSPKPAAQGSSPWPSAMELLITFGWPELLLLSAPLLLCLLYLVAIVFVGPMALLGLIDLDD